MKFCILFEVLKTALSLLPSPNYDAGEILLSFGEGVNDFQDFFVFGWFVLETIEHIIDDYGQEIVSFALGGSLVEIKSALVDLVELVILAFLVSELIYYLKRVLALDFIYFYIGGFDSADAGSEIFR